MAEGKAQRGCSRGGRVVRVAAGFSVVELMIVVAIIAILAGLAIWGYRAARDASRRDTTLGTLKVLEAIAQEYHTQTGTFFGNAEVKGVQTLVRHAANVDATRTLLLGLHDAYDKANGRILDAWDREIRAYKPAGSGQRPWFWSAGKNGLDESANTNGRPVQGDDLAGETNRSM